MPGPAAARRPAELRGLIEDAVRAGRLRRRKPARDRGAETARAGRDRRRGPARGGDRLLDLGAAADPAAGAMAPSRAPGRRPSVQPGLPAAARRDLRRRADRARPPRTRPPALYEAIGMRVLRVRKEIDGFIADRLLEALWREALWLVDDGVATTEEIDDAIRFGAGLRWSFMGTFLTYRLAGGRSRHAAFPGPVRPGPEAALDQAGRARTDRGADRPGLGTIRRSGGRRLDPRSRAQARRLPRGGAGRRCARRIMAPARCSRRTNAGCASRARPCGAEPRTTGRTAGALARPRPARLDRLQRPYDRAPLSAVFRRGDRRPAAPDRGRRRLSGRAAQLLHGRDPSDAPRRGPVSTRPSRSTPRSWPPTPSGCTFFTGSGAAATARCWPAPSRCCSTSTRPPARSSRRRARSWPPSRAWRRAMRTCRGRRAAGEAWAIRDKA